MRVRVLFLAAAVSIALMASAETRSLINYKPVACFRGGELPVLQMQTESQGELRAYFRRINTTDWCSVEGVNDGPLSRIILPKFDNGDEIEYFIVLLDGRRVIARSPRIYRAKVTVECETSWARHIMQLSLSCGEETPLVPGNVGAAYSQPVTATPSSPAAQ